MLGKRYCTLRWTLRVSSITGLSGSGRQTAGPYPHVPADVSSGTTILRRADAHVISPRTRRPLSMFCLLLLSSSNDITRAKSEVNGLTPLKPGHRLIPAQLQPPKQPTLPKAAFALLKRQYISSSPKCVIGFHGGHRGFGHDRFSVFRVYTSGAEVRTR